MGIGRGWRKEAGAAPPTGVIVGETEDLLTPTAGLDEEELGLPSQAGAAGSIEDVHNSLDGHRTSVRAINSPWELAVAGLGDQESWLQNQKAGVRIQHTLQWLCGAKRLEGPSQGHKPDSDGGWFWVGPANLPSRGLRLMCLKPPNWGIQPGSSRSVVLKLWSLDQWHQHHPGTHKAS